MQSVSPDIECIAGQARSPTGASTFFGNTFGKLTETNAWHVGRGASLLHRHHDRQYPHGHGHLSS